MKKTLLFLAAMLLSLAVGAHGGKEYEHSDIFAGLQAKDKVAILLVHFGTTHDDTRVLTIDAMKTDVQNAFAGVEVREAYTSRIVIKRLKDRGLSKQNPLESLNALHKDGYTHILIQASTVIDGVEMESLEKNVAEVRTLFKDIRWGTPLLYSPRDYEKIIDTLTRDYDSQTAYVWVGHGTSDATTAQYAMLDYMLKDKGHANCFVGTIEGYPTFGNMLSQVKKTGLKHIVLVPFMFVAGEHAKNDIAEDWKTDLEKEGYTVNVLMEGLGQNPLVRALYINHLKFMAKHRKIGIMEKKAIYAVTGEKMK